MGTSFGVVFLYNSAEIPLSNIVGLFPTVHLSGGKRALMQKEKQAENQALIKRTAIRSFYDEKETINKGIVKMGGQPVETGEEYYAYLSRIVFREYPPKVLYSNNKPWVCLSSTEIMGICGKTAILAAVRQYAKHFRLTALLMSVYDDDIVHLGYCNSRGGKAEYFVNGTSTQGTQYISEPPLVLLPYIREENHNHLSQIWYKKYTLASDRLCAIAALVGIDAALVGDYEGIIAPVGYEIVPAK